MNIHKNAKLTARGREEMIRRMGHQPAAAAESGNDMAPAGNGAEEGMAKRKELCGEQKGRGPKREKGVAEAVKGSGKVEERAFRANLRAKAREEFFREARRNPRWPAVEPGGCA